MNMRVISTLAFGHVVVHQFSTFAQQTSIENHQVLETVNLPTYPIFKGRPYGEDFLLIKMSIFKSMSCIRMHF